MFLFAHSSRKKNHFKSSNFFPAGRASLTLRWPLIALVLLRWPVPSPAAAPVRCYFLLPGLTRKWCSSSSSIKGNVNKCKVGRRLQHSWDARNNKKSRIFLLLEIFPRLPLWRGGCPDAYCVITAFFSCTIEFFPARKVATKCTFFQTLAKSLSSTLNPLPKHHKTSQYLRFSSRITQRKIFCCFSPKKHFFSSNYATDDVGERIGEWKLCWSDDDDVVGRTQSFPPWRVTAVKWKKSTKLRSTNSEEG